LNKAVSRISDTNHLPGSWLTQSVPQTNMRKEVIPIIHFSYTPEP